MSAVNQRHVQLGRDSQIISKKTKPESCCGAWGSSQCEAQHLGRAGASQDRDSNRWNTLSDLPQGRSEGRKGSSLHLGTSKTQWESCIWKETFLHNRGPGFRRHIPRWLMARMLWGRECQNQVGILWCKMCWCCTGDLCCILINFRRRKRWWTCWCLLHLLGEIWKFGSNCNSSCSPLGTANSKVGMPETNLWWKCSSLFWKLLLTFNIHLLCVLYEDGPTETRICIWAVNQENNYNFELNLHGAELKIHRGFSFLTPGGNWFPSVPFKMLQVLFPPVLPSTSARLFHQRSPVVVHVFAPGQINGIKWMWQVQ